MWGRADLAPSDATGIFVAPNGSDAAMGTMAAPVATIGRGVALATPSSKAVFIAAGTYSESVQTSVSLFGGFEAGTWVRDIRRFSTAISAGAPTVSNPSSFGRVGVFVPSGAQIAIDGLSINRGCALVVQGRPPGAVVLRKLILSTDPGCSPSYGVVLDAEGIVFESTIDASGAGSSTGLETWVDATSAHVYRSQITAGDSAVFGDGVLLFSGSNNLILDSRISGGRGRGGSPSGRVGLALGANNNARLGATVINSVIEGGDNAQSSTGVMTPGGNIVVGTLTLVHNVILAGRGDQSSALQAFDQYPVALYDNILIGGTTRTMGIMASAFVAPRWFYGNDLFMPNGGCLVGHLGGDCVLTSIADLNVCASTTCTSGGGNISADPQFVAGREYHLGDQSPCIGAGVDPGPHYPESLANRDFEGVCRPQTRPMGSGWDIGVSEHLP